MKPSYPLKASEKRLGRLIHRLQDQPTLLAEYDSIIQQQIRKGIICS